MAKERCCGYDLRERRHRKKSKKCGVAATQRLLRVLSLCCEPVLSFCSRPAAGR
jgi:hypothetical protein